MEILEYWPLILGILYYLFRSGKNKEKERRRAQPTGDIGEPMTSEEAESYGDPMESILDEIKRVKQTQTKKIEDTPDIEPVVLEEIPRKPERLRRTMAERRIAGVVEAAAKKAEEELEEDPVEFDLREAVIYDAILNRPWK